MFCKNKFEHMFYAGILQGILFMIIGVSDMVLTGFFFGADGVAAVAVSGPLGFIAGFCILVFASGCRIVYPEKIGGYDKEAANEYFSTAMTASIVLTILFTVIMALTGEKYFDIYKLSGNILTLSSRYIKYYKYVYVLSPIVSFIGQMVYCDGDSQICAIANTTFFVGNIVLSIIGALVIGIEGIGLGTLISGFFCMLIYCVHFLKENCSLKYRLYYSLKKQLEIVRYSFVESLYSLFFGLNGIILSKFIVSQFGEGYLAVYSVVGQALGLTAFFSIATEAMLPLLNIYQGEKNNDGVRKIMGVTVRWIIEIGILLTLIALLIAPIYPELFSLSDPELASICVTGIRIVSLTFVFNGLLSFLTTYFNASGHVIFATVIARCKDSFVHTICFIMFGLIFGVNGMWIGVMLCPLITFLGTMWVIRVSSKRGGKLKLPEKDDAIKSWDIVLNEATIMSTRNSAAEYLSGKAVPESIIRKIEFLIEESLMSICDHNASDKKILAELTIMCRKDIDVIVRDSGVTYDLSDEDTNLTSFRDYILTRFYEKIDRKYNGMSMSFNRTRFVFDDVMKTEAIK